VSLIIGYFQEKNTVYRTLSLDLSFTTHHLKSCKHKTCI